MPPFVRHIEGHTLTLDAGPTAWLWVLVALLPLTWVVLVAASERSGLREDWRQLLRGGVAGLGLIIGLSWLLRDAPAGSVARYFPDAYRPAQLALYLGGFTCVLLATELFLRAGTPKEAPRPVLLDLPFVLALGAGSVWLGHQRLQVLDSVEAIPQVAKVQGCEAVQQFTDCAPELTLYQMGVKTPYRGALGLFPRWDDMRPVSFAEDYQGNGWTDLRGWTIPPVQVDGRRPGQVRVQWTASNGPLQVRTTLGPFSVYGAQGDPRLALAPQTRFTYVSYRRYRRRVRFLRTEQSTGQWADTRIQVLSPIQVGAYQVLPLAVQRGEGPVEDGVHVTEIDGETRWGDGPEGIAAHLSAGRTQARRALLLSADEDTEGLIACESPVVPGDWECLCDLNAPAGQELVPVHCGHSLRHGLGETLLMGALNLFTLGAVGGLPEVSYRHTLESVELGADPLVAPEPEAPAGSP